MSASSHQIAPLDNRHSSPESSTAVNSTSSQSNIVTNDPRTGSLKGRHAHANDTSRQSRHGSLRRIGDFLRRPIGSHGEIERANSTENKVARSNGVRESKGKQRLSGQGENPRSDPAGQRYSMESADSSLRSSIDHVMDSKDPKFIPARYSEDSNFDSENDERHLRDGRGHASYPDTRSALDADQIVNMALSLSEGRRRHMSGSHLISSQPTRNMRVASGAPGLDYSHGSSVGGSLRRHLQDQRRISRSSPIQGSRSFGSSPRTSELAKSVHSHSASPDSGLPISSFTLEQVDKARRYIESSVRFRNLLSNLPPLKPRPPSSDEENAVTSNAPALGREYNPLQVIRNRKARARERLQLDHDPESWEDPEIVTHWLGMVKIASSKKNYIQGDEVMLPPFMPRSVVRRSENLDSTSSKVGAGNLRSNKMRTDWFVHPAEQLADAYWLELDQHKSIIENGHGAKIFPSIRISSARLSRPSLESQSSYQPSIQISAGSEQSADSDIEKPSDNRGRRRARIHDQDGSKRLKKVLNKARRRSRSASSDLSHSDDEVEHPSKRQTLQQDSGYDSAAPLAMQLSKILDTQHGINFTSSPPVISPGTPNKWGAERHEQLEKFIDPAKPSGINHQMVTPESSWKMTEEPSRMLGLPFSPQREARKSIDESNPSSPISTSFAQKGEDLRRITAATQSPSRLPKKKLPFSRAERSKGSKSKNDLPVSVDESIGHQRKESLHLDTSPEILASQSQQNGIRLPTQHTDPQYANSRARHRKKDSRDIKEPDSAVRRFLKGGIIGDLVRGEVSKTSNLIRRKDSWADASETHPARIVEDSDTEHTSGSQSAKNDYLGPRLKPKPNVISRISSAEPKSPQQKPKSRYHLDLPSFRLTSSPRSSRPVTPETDSRPSRDIELGFPLHLTKSNSSLSRTSTQNTSASMEDEKGRRLLPAFQPLSRLHSSSRLSAIIDSPEHKSSPVRTTAATTPRPPNQRHWSISDESKALSSNKPITSSITEADVARLRALLLCSGVKATEFVHSMTDPTYRPSPSFLIEAARSAKTLLQQTPQVHVHRAAADLLVSSLDKSSTALQHSASQFRNVTTADMRTLLTDLRTKVNDRIERARLAGDSAVGFGALVAGNKTIEVQQVVLARDKFKRKRGRRLRFIKRMGFGLIEWAVVFFMWGAWFIVLILKIFWGLVVAVVRFVRWALWLN
jgi:hypothetical protein